MADFKGKVALITGASGFLASGVIPKFREAGAHLVLPNDPEHVSKSLNKIAEHYPELVDHPDHLLADPTDLTDVKQVQALVDSALEKFGKIDILVNIVGGWQAGNPVHETDIEVWDNMMRLNAKTTFLISRAVIPSMLATGSGKIVSIGAKPGLKASGNDAAYSAAKSAVLRLTESMSEEYKKQGININAVLPSAIVPPEKQAEDPTAGVTPDQLAEVILFLCSDAASIIHGAIIPAFGLRF